MTHPPMANNVVMPSGLTVAGAEAGCKLLAFLERRCVASASELHRWIRTGQVRVNGGRTKPFVRLAAGDVVRVPPFAVILPVGTGQTGGSGHASGTIPVIAASSEVLLCVKPAGLPVHGGTGHSDSLIARLRAQEPDAPFPLTPAHRLDKATSGLLIVARTYTALRTAQDALAARCGVRKTYLAWVQGLWPDAGSIVLEDWLVKVVEPVEGEGMRERMRCVPAETPGADVASLTVRCVRRMENARQASLLELELHTGRTHQIRVQLATRGFPLIGDPKYGGPTCPYGMLLHAVQLEFDPAVAATFKLDNTCFCVQPAWPDFWSGAC